MERWQAARRDNREDWSVTRVALLVGSAAFWEAARRDIAAARNRVLVQAMTFEGDSAGLAVAGAIGASAAADRRVLVDDYTRQVINDTFLALSRDPVLTAEAEATWAMFDRLKASGAGVRITDPIGGNPLRYPTRNHKKLLVMDDVAWLGGINFSDHNFEWHDMMVRIEDRGIADWLAGEFGKDWEGRPASAAASLSGIDLLSLDGTDNAVWLEPLLQRMAAARRSIELISAYPTFPFITAMAEAASRGAAVSLYTPRPNNKPVIRNYLLGIARRSGLSIRLLPRMTHVKAMLIDGEELVVGSCNFEFVSYRANAELIATIRDPALIADFEARLFGPARAEATAPEPGDHSAWKGFWARLGLRAADILLAGLSHGPRIAELPRP